MPADRKHRGRSGFRGQGGCDICHRKHRSLYFQQPHQIFFFVTNVGAYLAQIFALNLLQNLTFSLILTKEKILEDFVSVVANCVLKNGAQKLHDKLVHQSPRNVLDKKIICVAANFEVENQCQRAWDPGQSPSFYLAWAL